MSAGEIEARLAAHPGGIAAKYARRLRREINRSFEKWRSRNGIAIAEAPATSGGASPSASGTSSPPLQWDSVDKNGIPKPTCANARIAIQKVGVHCSYDVFHDAMLLGGTKIGAYSGKISDGAIHHLRDIIHAAYRFDPGKEHTRDAAAQLCLRNWFDPVVDYVDGLRWDGTPRLETWPMVYLGAPDTPLIRAYGRITFVAAVRRARHPGCKFDQIIVLRGPEGIEKSFSIRALAGGDENFSDQTIIGMRDREQQECLCGRWFYEVADLSGMRRAEGEHVKAFASRAHKELRG